MVFRLVGLQGPRRALVVKLNSYKLSSACRLREAPRPHRWISLLKTSLSTHLPPCHRRHRAFEERVLRKGHQPRSPLPQRIFLPQSRRCRSLSQGLDLAFSSLPPLLILQVPVVTQRTHLGPPLALLQQFLRHAKAWRPSQGVPLHLLRLGVVLTSHSLVALRWFLRFEAAPYPKRPR